MARDVWGSYVTPDDFEAAAKRGICKQTVKSRVAMGWKAKDAISVPVLKTSDDYKAFKRKAVENGICPNTFKRRVQRGWSPESAASTPLISQEESIKRTRATRKRVIPKEAVMLAAKNGICYNTLYSRIRCGMPMKQATSTPVTNSLNHPWQEWNYLDFHCSKRKNSHV